MSARNVPAPWQAHAACKPYPIPMFFPEPSDDTIAALTICSTCPVRTECLTDALDNDDPGVRGETTAQQRGWIRRGTFTIDEIRQNNARARRNAR